MRPLYRRPGADGRGVWREVVDRGAGCSVELHYDDVTWCGYFHGVLGYFYFEFMIQLPNYRIRLQ